MVYMCVSIRLLRDKGCLLPSSWTRRQMENHSDSKVWACWLTSATTRDFLMFRRSNSEVSQDLRNFWCALWTYILVYFHWTSPILVVAKSICVQVSLHSYKMRNFWINMLCSFCTKYRSMVIIWSWEHYVNITYLLHCRIPIMVSMEICVSDPIGKLATAYAGSDGLAEDPHLWTRHFPLLMACSRCILQYCTYWQQLTGTKTSEL